MSNKHSTGLPPNSGKVQHVKLVLLGDQGVGKSSIALRFVRGEFYENNEATVGAAFLTQTVNVGEHAIKFDIWDTAGQERYHSLAPMYYRGAHAAIVVYDVTSTGSYVRAVSWVKELRQLANSQITIVLAGNKADMAPDSRTVATDEAKSFSDNNELGFFEASAKTGMSVHDMFMFLATKLARLNQGGTVDHRRGIQLNNKQRVKNSKKCC